MYIHIFLFKGDFTIKELLINEQIIAKEVRLIANDGEQLGVVSFDEALDKARQADLDLVQISPNAVPSVCKIMDYGKYRFDLLKKEKDARKKNKAQEVKTIQLSLTIGEHDMSYRVKNAIEFLKDGNKVKVNILLKGRQQAYPEQGIEIMNKFAQMLGDNAVIEKAPLLEGKFINMVLGQKK